MTLTRAERPVRDMHAIVEAAGARGDLPEWARCSPKRRAHAARVAELLGAWSLALGLPERERVRWKAAGLLHDALKGAATDELRRLAGPGWPDRVLHAPACAERLREAGVRDESLLLAIAYHPTGHPDFDRLGEYLMLADFLDPGRTFLPAECARLRERLPAERREALIAVHAMRVGELLKARRPLLLPSVHFWNRIVEP